MKVLTEEQLALVLGGLGSGDQPVPIPGDLGEEELPTETHPWDFDENDEDLT